MLFHTSNDSIIEHARPANDATFKLVDDDGSDAVAVREIVEEFWSGFRKCFIRSTSSTCCLCLNYSNDFLCRDLIISASVIVISV